ncbi:MAG: 6-carboxytetrahydropterin synthase [Oligoflexia bacterium]|nr:6-carboxytetrahydropterin synthase [Oligoflexia bacterium]
MKLEFPAAHHLVGYPGDCARLHGHNWGLEVFARSRKLDSIGMAFDFRELKKEVRELIAAWDHQDLNALPDFKDVNPSAEAIARIAFERLSARLDTADTWISRVTVWENERAWASYFDEDKSGA